jgi:hypothetical protein
LDRLPVKTNEGINIVGESASEFVLRWRSWWPDTDPF